MIHLHVFITSLTPQVHAEDKIEALFPNFVTDYLTESVDKEAYNFFYKKSSQPIRIKYHFEKGYFDIPIVIDGNIMCDDGQSDDIVKFWDKIKHGKKEGVSEIKPIFFREFLRHLTLIGRSLLSEHQSEIQITLYPHWGSDFQIAKRNLKAFIKDNADLFSKAIKNITPQRIKITPYIYHQLTHKKLNKEIKNWTDLKDCQNFKSFCKEFGDKNRRKDLFEKYEEELLKKANLNIFKQESEWDEKIDEKWASLLEEKFNRNIYTMPTRHTETGQSFFSNPKKSGFKKIKSRKPEGNVLKIKFVQLYGLPTPTTQEQNQLLGEKLFADLVENCDWTKIKNQIIEELSEKFEFKWKDKNQTKTLNIKFEEDENNPNLIIAFTKMRNFNQSEMFDKLGNRRSFLNPNSVGYFDFLPVITIGLMNVMTYYHDKNSKDTDAKKDFVLNAYQIYQGLQFDNRFRFFDSSIWFQYVGLTKYFERDFEMAILNVWYNWHEKIYLTIEANENLEFNLRLLKNSYVMNFGKDEIGPVVTPFVFHPESRMRRLAMKELAGILELKWQVLMVDDFADSELNFSKIFETEEQTSKTKKELIEDCIKGKHLPVKYRGYPNSEKKENDVINNITISTSPKIKDAFYKITNESIEEFSTILEDNTPQNAPNNTVAQTQQSENEVQTSTTEYDLILLNYLINYNPETKTYITEKNDMSYGYHLIQGLLQWTLKCELDEVSYEQMRQKLGPTEKFFFLPISSYAGAMEGKLKDLGIPLSHTYWEVGPGVDPLTTPQLFRYRIFYFLRKQLENLIFFKKELDIQKKVQENLNNGFFHKSHLINYRKQKIPQSLMFDYVERIANKHDEKSARDLQFEVLRLLPAIVELGVHFKRLKNHQKSNLAKDILKKYFFDFDIFAWEHFQHFFYLLSYGTFQQKQEMWEEYIYLLKIIEHKKEAFSLEETNQMKIDEFITHLSKIGNYVSQLGTYNK